MSNFLITVLGLPEFPSIREVNVRSGPSVNKELLFKITLGSRGYVKSVEPDSDKQGKDNKTYQWFKVEFFDGRVGYVRDDLIEIEGDGTTFGYPFIAQRVVAFKMMRQNVTPAPTTPSTPATPSTPPVQPVTPTTATTAPNPFTQQPITTGQPIPSTPVQPVQPVTPSPTAPQAPAQTTTPAPSPAPAVPQPAAPAPAPATPAPAPAASAPASAPSTTGTATALIMSQNGARMRGGPGVGNPEIMMVPYKTQVEVLGVQKDQDPKSRLRWVNIRASGKTGWTREDFLRLNGGDYQSLGLGFFDAFPAPTVNSSWVRDYNLDPNFAFVHYGWDLAAAVGEPIYAPPAGGKVVVASLCKACSPAKPNAQSHGFQTGAQQIINSPDWNYGYGHMVGIRVLHEKLPASTQAELAKRNLAGYHLYIIYAHMNSIEVQAGIELQPGQRLGTLGNTGNSEGPHLHLEVRAWNNPNETSLGASFKNHMTPAVVFRR